MQMILEMIGVAVITWIGMWMATGVTAIVHPPIRTGGRDGRGDKVAKRPVDPTDPRGE